MTTKTAVKKTPFNETDVRQKIDGLFDQNLSLATLVSNSFDENTVKITFSNKNPDGSSKTRQATFASPKETAFAKEYLEAKINSHRQIDRSHDGFAQPVARSSRRDHTTGVDL